MIQFGVWLWIAKVAAAVLEDDQAVGGWYVSDLSARCPNITGPFLTIDEAAAEIVLRVGLTKHRAPE
jgi:hypothetical protein